MLHKIICHHCRFALRISSIPKGHPQHEAGVLHSDEAILWRGRKRKSREVLTHSEFKVTTANLAPVIIYE
jgi:hypothetical protein